MKFTKENPLKVFTAFSGYDSQCMALERVGIPYDLVGWSEFDPGSKLPIERQPAVIAHNAVFPQYKDRNYGDISKIDWESVPDFELFTYSFPCQDISNAGLRRGLEEGSGTRSSLLWECAKAVEAKRPKYMVMENVKNLVSAKFGHIYRTWERYLAGLGYNNFCKVLNAADFGVPRARERIFVVSILDPDAVFYFPEPIPRTKTIKDLVETSPVDEKYYLRVDQVESIVQHCEKKQAEGCGFKTNFRGGGEIATCITTRYGQRQTDTYYDESK